MNRTLVEAGYPTKVMNGRVIGGSFLDGVVTVAPIGSGLVIQSGFKWRKLDAERVQAWEDLPSGTGNSAVSAVGQAVAGALLPKFLGKGASAAVGATLDSTIRPQHTVRVDWADGKQSLLKLPESLFKHLELLLRDQRSIAPVQDLTMQVSSAPAEPAGPSSISEQAFSLVSGLISDRWPASPEPLENSAQQDTTLQLKRLAALRDEGILTEEEFSAKKADLLSRM